MALYQSVVKWLINFFSKSNLWSIENKKLKEFHKKYYRSENRAYVLALEVGKYGNLKLESFMPYYNKIQRLKNNIKWQLYAYYVTTLSHVPKVLEHLGKY